jgi:hypothetical protein
MEHLADDLFVDTGARVGAFKNGTTSVLQSEAFVFDPTGDEIIVEMYDDGLHADGAAHDGKFGGQLPVRTLRW